MSDNFPILRSVMYVPGTDPEKIAKALSSQADGIILDLEGIRPRPTVRSRRAAMSWKPSRGVSSGAAQSSFAVMP